MFAYKTAQYGKNNKKVVFLLSGWGFDRRFFAPVAYILVIAGYKCIVYSYDASILSPDVHKTINRFDLVKSEIIAQVNDSLNRGEEPYAIFGTSLGAIIALMVVNESIQFKKIILNLVVADIAETIWSWDIVKPWFKKVLQIGGISLERLKNEWKEISPINNLNNLAGTETLLYITKRDQIFPYEQGKKLEQAFKEINCNYTLVENSFLRHVSCAAWNLINFPKYISFLKSTTQSLPSSRE